MKHNYLSKIAQKYFVEKSIDIVASGIFNMIKDNILIKQYSYYNIPTSNNVLKMLDDTFDDGINTNRCFSRISMNTTTLVCAYIIFRRAYPDEFKIVTSKTNKNYMLVPNTGVYITNYKNIIVICNVRLTQNEDKESNFIQSRVKSGICVELIYIGQNSKKLQSKILINAAHIMSNLYNKNKSDSVMVLRVERDGRLNGDYTNVKSIDHLIMDDKDKKEMLHAIYSLINHRDIYHRLSFPAKLGILLYGPIGTGKSSVAYAIANMLNCELIIAQPKYIMSGELMESDKFQSTELKVILLDELDDFLKTDDNEIGRLHKNQIIEFIDSIRSNTILVGTTNNIESIDPAIVRAGRFDLKIYMGKFDRDKAARFISNIKEYDLSYMLDWYEYPITPSQLQFDVTQELFNNIKYTQY